MDSSAIVGGRRLSKFPSSLARHGFYQNTTLNEATISKTRKKAQEKRQYVKVSTIIDHIEDDLQYMAKIQARVHKMQKVLSYEFHLRNAALLVQTWFRMCLAKNELKILRLSRFIIDRWRFVVYLHLRLRCSIVIIAAFRYYHFRCAYLVIRRKLHAARRIQRYYRGYRFKLLTRLMVQVTKLAHENVPHCIYFAERRAIVRIVQAALLQPDQVKAGRLVLKAWKRRFRKLRLELLASPDAKLVFYQMLHFHFDLEAFTDTNVKPDSNHIWPSVNDSSHRITSNSTVEYIRKLIRNYEELMNARALKRLSKALSSNHRMSVDRRRSRSNSNAKRPLSANDGNMQPNELKFRPIPYMSNEIDREHIVPTNPFVKRMNGRLSLSINTAIEMAGSSRSGSPSTTNRKEDARRRQANLHDSPPGASRISHSNSSSIGKDSPNSTIEREVLPPRKDESQEKAETSINSVKEKVGVASNNVQLHRNSDGFRLADIKAESTGGRMSSLVQDNGIDNQNASSQKAFADLGREDDITLHLPLSIKLSPPHTPRSSNVSRDQALTVTTRHVQSPNRNVSTPRYRRDVNDHRPGDKQGGVHFFGETSPGQQSRDYSPQSPRAHSPSSPRSPPSRMAQRYVRVFDKEHRTTVFDLVLLFIDLKRVAMADKSLVDGEVPKQVLAARRSIINVKYPCATPRANLKFVRVKGPQAMPRLNQRPPVQHVSPHPPVPNGRPRALNIVRPRSAAGGVTKPSISTSASHRNGPTQVHLPNSRLVLPSQIAREKKKKEILEHHEAAMRIVAAQQNKTVLDIVPLPPMQLRPSKADTTPRLRTLSLSVKSNSVPANNAAPVKSEDELAPHPAHPRITAQVIGGNTVQLTEPDEIGSDDESSSHNSDTTTESDEGSKSSSDEEDTVRQHFDLNRIVVTQH